MTYLIEIPAVISHIVSGDATSLHFSINSSDQQYAGPYNIKIKALTDGTTLLDNATITITLLLKKAKINLEKSFIPDQNFYVKDDEFSFGFQEFIVTGTTNYEMVYTVSQVNPKSSGEGNDLDLPESVEFDGDRGKFTVRR